MRSLTLVLLLAVGGPTEALAQSGQPAMHVAGKDSQAAAERDATLKRIEASLARLEEVSRKLEERLIDLEEREFDACRRLQRIEERVIGNAQLCVGLKQRQPLRIQ